MYLPPPLWQTLVLERYKAHLEVELAVAARAAPLVEADMAGRLGPAFAAVYRRLIAGLEKMRGRLHVDMADAPKLSTSNLDQAVAFFPPCMRRLHHTLRTEHHLKHEGRLLYTCFLKGAGVPVAEQLQLWESEFLHVKTKEEVAKKRYMYSIRHIYGLEGSRINRPPYSCPKIIKEHSGRCPFTNGASAREELDTVGVPQELQAQVRGPQSACACHFRAAANLPQHAEDAGQQEIFASPNHYFAAAVSQNSKKK